MKVRNSKHVTIDEVQLTIARRAILHPDLHREFFSELIELENKGKISLLPSTILEHYNATMPDKVAFFKECCRQRLIVLSYY